MNASLHAALVALLVLAGAARADMRSFPLQHASAEELIPVVQPLLGPYESVSAYRDTLVVNAGSGTLERVTRLLAELDVPRRNLLISLRRREDSSDAVAGISARGTVTTGDLHIGTHRGTGTGAGITVSGGRSISTGERGGEQSVRALEGSAVQIQDGQLVPLARGGIWGPQLDYTELQQGFAVRARVSGSTVTVDVLARDERLENGVVRTAAVQSSLSGALGEWIWLGGTTRTDAAHIEGGGTQYSTRSREDAAYEVRVELSP